MGRPKKKAEVIALQPVTNGAEEAIATEEPYIAEVTLEGSCPLLFHRWNSEAVEEKAKAKKNSKAKKTDDVETFVYRDEKGYICLPGEYLKMSIVGAAKFRQDPRSPRKSAMDLFKAGVVAETHLASLGSKNWDYLDRRRVVVQRAGITRSRPGFEKGWQATIRLLVLLPEYIDPAMLHEVITQAGKLIGVGDYRPSFGRFQVTRFKVL